MRSVLGSYLLVVTDADHYVVSFAPNRLPNAQLLMMLKQPLIESASVYEYSTGWFFFLSWLKSLIYRTRIRFELGSGLRKNFSVAHSLFILDPSADGFGNARVSSGKLCSLLCALRRRRRSSLSWSRVISYPDLTLFSGYEIRSRGLEITGSVLGTRMAKIILSLL